eukprot:Sspe_Gene.68716::Locus_40513_Transcript_1_1_Confidence_1.000_Length_1239::g.68716::m.68716
MGSQEVVGRGARDLGLTPPRGRVVGHEVVLEFFVHFHAGSLVPAPVAVVRCTPHGDHALFVTPLVPLHDQLVGSGDELQVVGVEELLAHIGSEDVPSSTRGHTVPLRVVVGVTPHQITHGALMRHFNHPVNRPNVVQRVEGGGEATVGAKDAFLDYGCEGHVVKGVCELLPHCRTVVLPHAFIIEPVHLSDLPAFVIPTQQRDSAGVPHLVQEEEGDGLDGVVPSVNEVAEEEVVCVGRLAANVKQLKQVMELSVNVADDGGGGRHGMHVLLPLEHHPRPVAEVYDVLLRDELAVQAHLDQCIEVKGPPRHPPYPPPPPH